MFRALAETVVGVVAYCIRGFFAAPGSLARSFMLLVKGDYSSSLDVALSFAATYLWFSMFTLPYGYIVLALIVVANVVNFRRWDGEVGPAPTIVTRDDRTLREVLSTWWAARSEQIRVAVPEYLDNASSWELLGWLVVLLYGSLFILLFVAEGMPLMALLTLAVIMVIAWIDFWKMVYCLFGDRLPSTLGSNGQLAEPIIHLGRLASARQWLFSIPRKIGMGYAIIKRDAESQGIYGTGPIWGFTQCLFNAFVIYNPKAIRRLFAWMYGVEVGSISRGLIAVSPFVAYGVATGADWAVAIVGHEFGHIWAYDERQYDWWYWVGFFGPDLLAVFGGGVAWMAHAAITLVNEAWATYNAWRGGYVRSAHGGLVLALAYCTYVQWAWGIFDYFLLGGPPPAA